MIDSASLCRVLLAVLPVLYLAALAIYALAFWREQAHWQRWARPSLLVAVAVHATYVVVFTAYFEHLPMVTVAQVAGVVGLALALTYLWVETRTHTIYSGPFVIALVFGCVLTSTLRPHLDHAVPSLLQSTLFSFHVSAAVLGYSAFALAAVYGLLYLLLYRRMRDKQFGLVFRRLPPLETLDRMNLAATSVGFVCLTVAVLLGALWSFSAFGGMHVDAKIATAFATWLLYGLTLAGRRYRSWRGPRLAYSSLLGFAAVLFSMVAVNLWFTNFHTFT